MCRNHLSFIKDHLSVLLTLFGLLQPVIFGRLECDKKLVILSLKHLLKVFRLFLQLVVVRADLNGHLKALKDYFLLAKGDFFQVRMDNISICFFSPFCILVGGELLQVIFVLSML